MLFDVGTRFKIFNWVNFRVYNELIAIYEISHIFN